MADEVDFGDIDFGVEEDSQATSTGEQTSFNDTDDVDFGDIGFDDTSIVDEVQKARKSLMASDDLRSGWTSQGEIGWSEYVTRFQNDLELLPFAGAAALYEPGSILYKANKLKNNEYTIEEAKQKEADYQEVKAFTMKMEELEHRGLSFGSKFWSAGAQTSTFFLEFIGSAGIYPIAKAGAKEGAKQTVKRTLREAAKGYAKSSAKLLAKEAKRTALFMGHRVALNYMDRRLSDTLAITDKGDLAMREASEHPAATAIKAFSGVWIENITEVLVGPALGDAATAMGRKLPEAMVKKFIEKIPAGKMRTFMFGTPEQKKLAFSGILGEFSEERAAEILNVGVEAAVDAAGGKKIDGGELFDKFVGAMFPDAEQAMIEVGLFSVFGGVSYSGQKLIKHWESRGMSENQIQNMFQTMSESEKDFEVEKIAFLEKEVDKARTPEVSGESSAFDNAYRHTVNRFQPIEDVSKEAEKLGIKLDKNADPLLVSRQYLGMGPMIKTTLEENTYNIDADGNINITGEGLKPILDGFDQVFTEFEGDLEARRADFQDYLIARRTLEDLVPREDVEVTDQQQAEAIETQLKLLEKYGEANIRKFAEFSERLYGYQSRVLENLVDSGQMSEADLTLIYSQNQRYIPFDRVLPEDTEQGRGVKKEFSKAKAKIKKIKGSELEIENVYESVIKNTIEIMERAQRNRVAKAVAKASESIPGIAEEVEFGEEVLDSEKGGELADIYDFEDGKITENGEVLSDTQLPEGDISGPIDSYYHVDDNYTEKERAIAQRYKNYVNQNYEKVRQDYIARVKKEFGADNVVSGDESKFILPGVDDKSPALFRLSHPAASAFAKSFRNELLADPKTKDKPVLLTGGGSGAGKTSGLKLFGNLSKYALIIDTNSADTEGVRSKYNLVKKSGRDMVFLYVERDPIDAWTSEKGGGVIKRQIKTGRPVPMDIHMMNQGSRHVVRDMSKNFSKEIADGSFSYDVIARDSKGQPVFGKEELLIDTSYTEDTQEGKDELQEKLQVELDKWKQQGKIDQEQYNALSFQNESSAGTESKELGEGSKEGIPRGLTPKGNVIEYYEDGQRKFIKVEKGLYEAMTGMSEGQMSLFMKIMAAPATALRTGATITPDFIASNFLRDQFTAAIQTNIGFRPFIDPIIGMADILGKKGDYLDWIRSGGAYSGLVETGRDSLKRAYDELSGKKSLLKKLNIVTTMGDISQFFEQATRVGMYRAAKRKGMSDIEAGFESREGTLDFSRRGASTRNLNAVKAFLNAGVQSFDKTLRIFKANPVATTTKGMAYITVPTIMLYMKNRDDDEYWELPQWRRDLFWNMKVDVGDETTWLSIPKPFGLGQIFGTLPERFLQHIDKSDPHAFDDFAGNMADSLLPASSVDYLFPTSMVPIIEGQVNYNFFTGRDLVPSYKLDREPFLQYNKGTSETSKEVGKALNVSPAVIDNTIRGYLGSSGRYALEASDALVNGIKKSAGEKVVQRPKTVTDIPFVRRFVRSRPFGYQSQSVQRFFDLSSELKEIHNTSNALKNMRSDRYEEYRNDHAYELRMYKRFQKVRGRIGKFGNAIDRAVESDDTKENKLQYIRENEKSMTEVAKNALSEYEGGKK